VAAGTDRRCVGEFGFDLVSGRKGYISDIRALLGDDPRKSRFIVSVDGGYRFIAAVTTRPGRAERRARCGGLACPVPFNGAARSRPSAR